MPKGGARIGAGRKPGATTKMNEEARKAALEGGITPLEYMLGLLRDETNDEATRFEAAKAAAPYVHARLANIEHSGEIVKTYVVRMPAPVENMSSWQQRYAPKHKQPTTIN